MKTAKEKMKQIEKRKKEAAFKKEGEQIIFLNQFRYFGAMLLAIAIGVFLLGLMTLILEP